MAIRSALLLLLAALLPCAFACGQDAGMTKFVTDFSLGFDHNDPPTMDKAVKFAPDKAVEHFQALRVDVWGGKPTFAAKCEALKASYARVFQKATVLEKIERWLESQDQRSYGVYLKAYDALRKCYQLVADADKDGRRATYDIALESTTNVATKMEETGHKQHAAEAWLLVSVIYSKVPERGLKDFQGSVFALEQWKSMRDAWEYTQDTYYALNCNSLKGERERLAKKEKDEKARSEAGYKADSKGIEGLVMPDAKDDLHDLAFAPLKDWESELDYSGKGGPLPQWWWFGQLRKDATSAQLTWFARVQLHLVRLGAAKFGVSINPAEPKAAVDIEIGQKAKPTSFFLDAEKKIPYAMFFWTGTDKEHVGEADTNLSPSTEFASIYYHSAASWTATVGTETLTFYDDNASGTPMDSDPFGRELKVHTLGKAEAVAPLLDSMRIGKGPRVPYSEFALVGGSWHYLHRVNDKVGLKLLNPKFFKTGKVKLVWGGGKPTAPVQLVIEGTGDFKSACFEIASGKDVEVPAGEYRVIFGRVLQGKGGKTQMATIYQGDSKPFTVEEGKVFDLKMGAPFSLHFERSGTDQKPVINATQITLHESSGCVLAELHGMVVVPEVMAAKAADGKGATMVGKFTKLQDPELLNKAATKYGDLGLQAALFPMPEGMKDGNMDLEVKVPAAGMKLQLLMKKHPLFGALASAFQ